MPNTALLKRLLPYAAVAAATLACTLGIMNARAAGIPDAAALTYTGYLENPDGTPVTSTKGIGISLYAAESGGKEVCGVKPTDIEPAAGRFQIPLPEDCTAAVKANPDLWAEVMVEGALLGRTKLGAVPYAVEAGHATNADLATKASKASLADRVALITDWTADPHVRLHGIGDDKDVNNQTTTSAWRRVGDSLELSVTTSVAGTPTQGTGGILWSMPAGLTADATKMNRNINGPSGTAFVSHGGTFRACQPYLGGSLQEIAISCPDLVGPPIGISGVTWVQFTITIPVVGWSNNP